MDPFVEHDSTTWQSIHTYMIVRLAEQALPLARARGLWVEVGRSIYLREPDGELTLVGEPDVLSWRNEARPTVASMATLPVAQPQAVHEVVLSEDDVHKQDYLILREDNAESPVLALVELLSPSNKLPSGYGVKYREKRSHMIASRSHFLEIDLLRSGWNTSRDRFPELPSTPYFAFLARKTGIGRNEEGYPIRLDQPLPILGLPTYPGTPDLPLDLQAAFTGAYENSVPSSRARRLYAEPLPPGPLSEEDREFVEQTMNARQPS
jgi:hypothetical protein